MNTRRAQRGIPRSARLLVWSLALVALSAHASAQTLPADAQVPIFFKLLTYDRTLWEDPPERLHIGLLHRQGYDASRANLTAVAAALGSAADKTINGVPFDFTTITWSGTADLAARLEAAEVDVLYVTAGHAEVLDEIVAHTRAAGILTLAGHHDDVEAGLSVGLGLENGRPRLLVNLRALEAEGHQLEARVLKLSRVVAR